MKKRLVFINQYYHPDLASTGQLLTELTQSLVDDFAITVIAAYPSYSFVDKGGRNFGLYRWEEQGGVKVLRVCSTTFQRRFKGLRLINYLSFFLSAWIATWFIQAVDLVVAQTDPPVIGWVGRSLARRKRVPLVLIFQDIFPEIAEVLGALNRVTVWLMRKLRKCMIDHSTKIVAISEGTSAILKSLFPHQSEKFLVIHNWVDTEAIRPWPAPNRFREEHQLEDDFLLMHSGNIGQSQDFALILDTAWYLSKQSMKTVIVGDGAQAGWLQDQIRRRSLQSQVIHLEYQPKEKLSESLAAADLHWVTLKPGLANLIVPSKVYGIMAVARPFLAVVPKSTEVSNIIDQYECGVWAAPHPKDIAQLILDLAAKPGILKAMGERGRATAESQYARPLSVGKYRELFRSLLTNE